MKEKEILDKWFNNVSEKAEAEKRKLHDLESNKEENLKSYRLYASTIEEWLRGEVPERIRVELIDDIQWLDSQEEDITNKIRLLKLQIEAYEFTLSKLKQIT